MREIVIGGAQLGAIQRGEDRASVVARMITLLERAATQGCTLVVFPELALTTFFPRWLLAEDEIDDWFEHRMPNEATAELFERARALQVAISFGYAERTDDGHRYNTSVLTDRAASIVARYRKIHLPGHSEFDPERRFQHLEKRYFEPGDLGFPVTRSQEAWMGMCICNDRRWPETYRVMGLQGVELITLGYNTPSVNSQNGDEGLAQRLYHSELSMTAGAYQNSSWVVGVAKAGIEDGHPLMGGSMIVDPSGYVVTRCTSEDDELMVHACDMDACHFGKRTIFDFARHRRIEHYGLITQTTGVRLPEGSKG